MRKLHLYKIYTPREVAIYILKKEDEIINLLEKKKTIGRKMMGFWYVRGREVIEIQKLLKGVKNGKNSINRRKGRGLDKEKA